MNTSTLRQSAAIGIQLMGMGWGEGEGSRAPTGIPPISVVYTSRWRSEEGPRHTLVERASLPLCPGFTFHFSPSPASAAIWAVLLLCSSGHAEGGRAFNAGLFVVIRGQPSRAQHPLTEEQAVRVNAPSLIFLAVKGQEQEQEGGGGVLIFYKGRGDSLLKKGAFLSSSLPHTRDMRRCPKLS